MTKKEQLRMDNLIHQNILLQDKINQHMKIYAEVLGENVDLKARIETMREVMNWRIGAEYEK